MENKKNRQVITANAAKPMTNTKNILNGKYELWTKYCLRIINNVRDIFISEMYKEDDSKGQFLTEDQKFSYEECHRMWLNPGIEMNDRIYQSYKYFVNVINGSNNSAFNSFEAERIIKLCDYLLFQYNKALNHLDSYNIIGSVESLLEKGAIVPKEAEIYSAKTRKENGDKGFRIVIKEKTIDKLEKSRADQYKKKIKLILSSQGKDPGAIESLLLLCDDPYVAETIANSVEKNRFESIYQIIKIAEEEKEENLRKGV